MNLGIGLIAAVVFTAYLLIVMTALRLYVAHHANTTAGKALGFIVG